MTPTCIELSDAGIIAAGGSPAGILPIDGDRLTSPGVALHRDNRLELGHRAADQARLFPRQVVNRFWDRLDTRALQLQGVTAANHADLAHAHLQQIWSVLRPIGEVVVFCVPGHYRRDNLGLLLGIAQELEINVVGFLPIALAAVDTAAGGDIVHVDLHLHRCEITHLRHDGDLAVAAATSLPDAGLEPLYRIWVETAARELLQTSRFDLFHSAASEQAVYRHLPMLLATLGNHGSARFDVSTGRHHHPMTLQRRIMIEAVQPVYTQIGNAIRSLVDRNHQVGRPVCLQLSLRAAELPGLKDYLATLPADQVQELAFGAAAMGAAGCWPALAIGRSGRKPSHHTRRPVGSHSEADKRPSTLEPVTPTHLLYRNTAYPIGPDPLVIGTLPAVDRGTIRLVGERISPRHCSFHRQDGLVFLDNHSEFGTLLDGVPIVHRARLKTGQTIVVGSSGVVLRLIACQPGTTDGDAG